MSIHILESEAEAPMSITTIYVLGVTMLFPVAGLIHLSEATCLLKGGAYLLCLPSTYILLIIYSFCNITDRSWGKEHIIYLLININTSMIKIVNWVIDWLIVLCLTPPSAIFQLYHGDQFSGARSRSTRREPPTIKGVAYVEATEAAASVKNVCKKKYKDN